MQKKTPLAVVVMAATALFYSGCCTTCPRSKSDSSLAKILVQPSDTMVKKGEQAKLCVEVQSSKASYQWFRNMNPLTNDAYFTNTTSSTLTVNSVNSTVDANTTGFYWCDITTLDPDGLPAKNRTRSAALGYYEEAMIMTGDTSGPITKTWPMPTGAPGSLTCSPPKSLKTTGVLPVFRYFQSGTNTKATIRLKDLNATPSAYQPVKNYCLVWRATSSNNGCVYDSTTNKTDLEVTCGKAANLQFLVYFITSPPTAHNMQLEVTFKP